MASALRSRSRATGAGLKVVGGRFHTQPGGIVAAVELWPEEVRPGQQATGARAGPVSVTSMKIRHRERLPDQAKLPMVQIDSSMVQTALMVQMSTRRATLSRRRAMQRACPRSQLARSPPRHHAALERSTTVLHGGADDLNDAGDLDGADVPRAAGGVEHFYDPRLRGRSVGGRLSSRRSELNEGLDRVR